VKQKETMYPSLAEQIGGWCVHFTGIAKSAACRAGVRYADVEVRHNPIPYTSRDGREYSSGLSLPCIKNHNHCGTASCVKAHFLTDEEAEQSAAREMVYINETTGHVFAVRAHIARTHGKYSKKTAHDERGAMPCPKCTGTLHWSRAAYNGHIWGQCSTEGCLSWME
jgi:hypothetical protein